MPEGQLQRLLSRIDTICARIAELDRQQCELTALRDSLQAANGRLGNIRGTEARVLAEDVDHALLAIAAAEVAIVRKLTTEGARLIRLHNRTGRRPSGRGDIPLSAGLYHRACLSLVLLGR